MHPQDQASHAGRGWQFLSLLGWLALVFAAAAIGAAGSADAREFYGDLESPGWAPPAALFGPVWAVLYAMMGTAAWLVWREPGPDGDGHRAAFAFFLVQLVLNALWPWFFFEWRRGDLATGDIALLWIFIALTIAAFWRVRPLAGVLLLPYLAWVTYAAALTWTLWQMNPELLGRLALPS
jgi:tryptophan-rich sensory protein